MGKKKVEKRNRYLSWITPGFFILLFGMQVHSYIVYTPKFRPEKSRITVAEIYSVESGVRGRLMANYVYKVDSVWYKSATGGNREALRNMKYTDSRKYPVIYNIENPKIHLILSAYRLPDSLSVGRNIKNVYINYEDIKTRMLTEQLPTVYVKAKYLEDYFQRKRILKMKS